MIEANLNHLELQIETLIKIRNHLSIENQSLRHKLGKTTHDRAVLADKNKNAASKIKKIISQLKNEA